LRFEVRLLHESQTRLAGISTTVRDEAANLPVAMAYLLSIKANAMKVLTSAEMGAADRATIDVYGVPMATLMENAGAAVARFLRLQWPAAKRVLVVCGKGNNGGDGMVAARLLANDGLEVTVVLLASTAKVKGAAADNLLRLMPEPVVAPDVETLNAAEVQDAFAQADVIVDAVYGTGFRPPLDALTQAVKAKLDALPDRPVLAVDMPSGWDADSREPVSLRRGGRDMGQPAAPADVFRADAVVTFTAPKLAHVFGELTRGPIVMAAIGSPEAAIQSSTRLTFGGASKAKFERKRARDGNKGQYGHVLLVGGARGKAGAPSMSSLACMRVGAGLTTAAVASSILPTVARIAPELMTAELDETADGEISAANASSADWLNLLEKKSVLAMGPGLGQSDDVRKFVQQVVANTKMPLVLDADGLNAYDKGTENLRGGGRTLVLTPHPGEMARLLGCTVKEVEADRENIARKFATEHELILVLKGWRTLIAHPDGTVAVNTSGNPGMAKGGSGDVLTGLVAGLLAQADAYGATAGEAVEAAVYLHGLAADMAVAAGDEHCFLPTDLLQWLPQAFRFRTMEEDGFCWVQGFPEDARR
jgi:NAD(P)H-hydrate epimerase